MDTFTTITPKLVIDRVQEVATATYGPIGLVNFEFIPLPEDPDTRTNWDLAFRPAPADPDMLSDIRIRAIERAIAEVRAIYPQVRWP
jgi:hypothetical protein